MALPFGCIDFSLFFVHPLRQLLLNALGFAYCALLLIGCTANWKQAALHTAFLTLRMAACKMRGIFIFCFAFYAQKNVVLYKTTIFSNLMMVYYEHTEQGKICSLNTSQ